MSALKAFATHCLADRLTRTALAALGDADVVPIKGVLFARTLYPDPADRPLTDVDLVLARPGLLVGLHRLRAAGFTARSWSADLHVELGHPRAPGLALDLHRAPLTAGFGAMSTAWLTRDAREDTRLFGARVLVPTPARQLAITLGAIVRDHVFRAPPHAARDVDALLHRAGLTLSDAERTLREVRFRRGAWAALQWVRRLAPSPAVDSLADALDLSLSERLWATRALAAFEAHARAHEPSRASSVLTQLMSDDASDVARGLDGDDPRTAHRRAAPTLRRGAGRAAVNDALTAAELVEKRSPPRPLVALDHGLYGAPLAGGSRAWAAWLWVPPTQRGRGLGVATLRAMVALAQRDGARSITAGGPPGDYALSGVDARNTRTLDWLARRGFTERDRRLDLTVATRPSPPHPAVARCDARELAAVCGWIAAHFADAWAMEAARSAARDGLFVARDGAALVGFAAHSGSLADRGTFGPIGVLPEGRGAGVGRALAERVFADLYARGFERAVVPWVAPATARFYRAFAEVIGEVERRSLTLDLTAPEPRTGSV